MDDRKLEDHLQEFGLSEKEATTYLTILRHGGAKASTISEEAGVSKRYVYSISEELERRGFVEVKDHMVPTIIEAKPPDEVIASLSDSLDTLRPQLNDRFTSTTEDLEEFEVVKSRVTVEKRLATLIETADQEIALSLPIEMLDQVEDELTEAINRGVLVLLVLTGSDGDDRPDAETFEKVASVARIWREQIPMILTVDGTYGLVAPVEMLSRFHSDMRAISLVQPQIVPILSGSFLGNYWPMAEEAYHEEPQDLPTTFRSFRHAVLQAELHRRANGSVTASVEARPVFEDGDYRTIRGEVTGVRQSIISPATNSFPVENSLIINNGGESVSVGGPGAFVEDFESREIVLEKP